MTDGVEQPIGGTGERILDATLGCISDRGLRRLTVDHVAAQAGVSRQTVYRYFGSRDGLLEAVILREESRLLERMTSAVAQADGLEDAIRRAAGTVLRAAREHPLLDRLLRDEPEALLPFLMLGRGPVVSAAEPVVRELLGRYVTVHDRLRLDAVARATTRLIVSYALAPEEDPDATAEMLAVLLTRGLGAK